MHPDFDSISARRIGPLDYIVNVWVWCYLRQWRCEITKQHKQQILRRDAMITLACTTSLPPSLPAQGPCSISRALSDTPGIFIIDDLGTVWWMIDTSV